MHYFRDGFPILKSYDINHWDPFVYLGEINCIAEVDLSIADCGAKKIEPKSQARHIENFFFEVFNISVLNLNVQH
jgi:hypothetical protein